MRKMIIAVVIIFGGLIVYNLIKQATISYYFNYYKVPAVTVSAIMTKPSDWHPYFSSVGTFVAINGVDVGTQSAGKVTAIHFNSGQYVEKDSPLIDIDDSVDQALLKFNQANLVLQKTNYQRQTDLLKRNATAVSNVDEARAKMLQAEANVENTQAQINLKHIRAPFSGLLGIRKIDLGQYIQPGTTTIVPLQSLDPIYLRFYIPEQYLNLVKIGQKILFTVEQSPGIQFHGEITAIDSKIDAKTHNIQVQATVENCPALNSEHVLQSDMLIERTKLANDHYAVSCSTIRNHSHKLLQYNFIPGMFSAIELEQPVIHNVIAIPTTAISYTMYGDSVFVVQKQENKEHQDVLTVKRVYVVAGETQGNYTVIKKGLQPQQLIVTAGELKLQDGSEVIVDPNNILVDHNNIDLLGE